MNGTWQFSPKPYEEFWKQKVINNWKDIEVPGEWVVQGFTVEPRERAAYFRKFTIPSDWSNKEIILRCDAVYSDAIIWIKNIEKLE